MAATVTKAGDIVAEGVLVEDPAVTVLFVRSYLAAHGAALQPGERIIAGSVVAPVAVAPGDELSVSFGPLGHLSVRFSD
jgi:2-oxo-hept-3-ene-1,7-dioate hydratase